MEIGKGIAFHMTYEVHFDRKTNFASCGDIVCREGTDDPYFNIARMVLDLNMPDSDGVFIDEIGMRCITVKSMHSCGRRYRPDGVRKKREWPEGARQGRKPRDFTES